MNKKQLLRKWVESYKKSREDLIKDVKSLFPYVDMKEIDEVWEKGIYQNWPPLDEIRDSYWLPLDNNTSYFLPASWWTFERRAIYRLMRYKNYTSDKYNEELNKLKAKIKKNA